jgi:crotonobetainyl-CoA:carnitine CoA-transferase CaiB-like acyl-CoA transferase
LGAKARGIVENKSPFSRIRIVECGEGISAAFGAKMIADLGALS